ncbi:hypothetical protein AMAG_14293 [Allomyces macrogynus ATCC 38327]|uniref:Uncharacterized protein n=1 Tax=Allomyces macrogynus (strain ATCC 38327) TaxID=578462 RepID=A0A0L0T4T3_ALLM3|nr:hypothetical protein AMAG_14293 [Allomyces macrogynus ATCC 38327]|eukprot:KNE69752.1 hypothetical protein AMAG_14293 [Allomyces macrogynus ATCC 38327]
MSVTLTAATAAHTGPIILAVATAVTALAASVMQTNRRSNEPWHAADTPLDPRDPGHLRPDDVALIGDSLAAMVQFKKSSYDDLYRDRDAAEHAHENPSRSRPERLAASRAALLDILACLHKTYPLTHTRLHVEHINTYSLLTTWHGSEDFGAAVDSDAWRDPAHGATFGYDEEIGGFAGSAKIAAWFRKRGVESLAMVVDEGTMTGQDIGLGPDMSRIALVGIAQKGVMSLKMTPHRKADGSSHTGTPSHDDPVVVLARGITATEEREQRVMLDTAG